MNLSAPSYQFGACNRVGQAGGQRQKADVQSSSSNRHATAGFGGCAVQHAAPCNAVPSAGTALTAARLGAAPPPSASCALAWLQTAAQPWRYPDRAAVQECRQGVEVREARRSSRHVSQPLSRGGIWAVQLCRSRRQQEKAACLGKKPADAHQPDKLAFAPAHQQLAQGGVPAGLRLAPLCRLAASLAAVLASICQEGKPEVHGLNCSRRQMCRSQLCGSSVWCHCCKHRPGKQARVPWPAGQQAKNCSYTGTGSKAVVWHAVEAQWWQAGWLVSRQVQQAGLAGRFSKQVWQATAGLQQVRPQDRAYPAHLQADLLHSSQARSGHLHPYIMFQLHRQCNRSPAGRSPPQQPGSPQRRAACRRCPALQQTEGEGKEMRLSASGMAAAQSSP